MPSEAEHSPTKSIEAENFQEEIYNRRKFSNSFVRFDRTYFIFNVYICSIFNQHLWQVYIFPSEWQVKGSVTILIQKVKNED